MLNLAQVRKAKKKIELYFSTWYMYYEVVHVVSIILCKSDELSDGNLSDVILDQNC